MKKYYQYIGILVIMLFSFYYTEQIATIVLNKNPLMKEINQEKSKYEVESVNAIIDGDYIIPGINGLTVNARQTYYNMQKLEAFNKYYLVYNQKKPDISLEENKDKIIKSGNKSLRKVNIIFDKESNLSDYFLENKIKANVLVTLNTYQKNNFFEPINNDINQFKSLEHVLNLNKENKKLCYVSADNLEVCKKSKNYLIEPTLTLKENNIIEVKNNINNGSIIFVNYNAHLSDLMLLLKEIKFKDLEIVYLSELISEVR